MAQGRLPLTTSTILATLMNNTTAPDQPTDAKDEPSEFLTILTSHESHTTANLRGLSTPSSSVAWASGENGSIVRTSDGGLTWEVANTPLIQDSESSGIFSIAFYDLKNGAISGGDYKQPDKGGSNLALTRDGGHSWQLATNSQQAYWSAVSFTPDHENLMLVGPTHAGLTSSAAPKLWQKSWNVSLNALSFWSENKALAVGPEGEIMEFEYLIKPQ